MDRRVVEGEARCDVLTFCVYGFHVGCQAAATLRKAGFDAKYMAGGHYAWKAINGPTKLFE
jgi:Fe-Mn family superoxide dismutase